MMVPLLGTLAWFFKPDDHPIEKPVSRWEIPVGEGRVLMHANRQGMDLSSDGM